MTETSAVASKFGRVAMPGNVLVLAAITMVSMAVGFAFTAQLGLPVWAATTLASFVYLSLLMSHMLLLRGRRISALEQEIERLSLASGRDPERNAGSSPSALVENKDAGEGKSAGISLKRALAKSPFTKPAPSKSEPLKSETPKLDPIARAVGNRATKSEVAAKPAPRATSLEEEMALARAMAEPEQLASATSPSPATAASAPEPAIAARPAVSRPLDADTIHQLVKKLAVEAAAQPTPRAGKPAQVVPAAESVTPQPEAQSQIDGDAITESVRALRAAAEAMRPGEQDLSMTPQEAAFEASPPELTAEQDARLAALAEALSADRIDVLLQPILGLKDQITRHYEVSIGLKTPEGATLDPAEDRRSLLGTGILPLIDLAKISRIAEVARKLAERGKSGAVFTGVAGESLSDDDFLSRFSDIYNDRASITEQLVVSLAQEDVRLFAPGHWDMLKDLSSVGFRFALEHVTDLDMDFDSLKQANIQYVKLDAGVYLRGLGAGNGVMVPPADVYRFLAEKGLSLIIDHIDSEAQLTKVVDYGALYGQGRLFGGARPVKANVFTASRAASAA